jgi:hypothetical protein
MKEFLEKENYNLIEEHNFLKNCKLMVIDILRLGWVCMGCGKGKKLVLQ